MEVALEIARYKAVFKGKLANLLPNDEKRLDTAKLLRAAMEIQGFGIPRPTSLARTSARLTAPTTASGATAQSRFAPGSS